MLRRLAAITRAWTTRRLLWLWIFAYACVLTSGFVWPLSAKNTYFECPRFLLPSDAVNLATDFIPQQGQAGTLRDVRALIVRDGFGSYAYRLPGRTYWDNVRVVRESLNDLPNLKCIYVGGYHDAGQYQRIRTRLPGIRVWRLDLNGARLASTFFLLMATLTLGGAVLQQSQAFFSLPHVRTFPRYIAPHLLFLGAISGVGILVTALIAERFGANFWETAAVQVFAWAAWSAFEFRLLALRAAPSPGDASWK